MGETGMINTKEFSIYVAAGSGEMVRATSWITKLEQAGIKVTCTWPTAISAVGQANPSNSTVAQRRVWAYQDMIEVKNSSALWLLMPVVPSMGAFWEFGFAFALDKNVWVSGSDLSQSKSIFTALAEYQFHTDETAFESIVRAAFPVTV